MRRTGRILLLLGGLFGALVLVRPLRSDPGQREADLSAPRSSCSTCALGEDDPPRYMSEASMDSIGRSISVFNQRLFERTDSLYSGGAFGPVGSPAAQTRACIHLQLRVRTGMTYIHQLAVSDPLLMDEASLIVPFGQVYENYGVYPVRFLRRALAGRGGFCMNYEFPRSFRSTVLMGGVRVPTEVDTVSYQGGPAFPAISMDYPTSQYKTVQLLYEARFCGRVTLDRMMDGGDTLEVQVLDDLEGIYVRRWGLHRLRAIGLWRSVVHGDADPKNPRVGAVAYFPHLELRMPFFLPNLGFSDLRSFDLPAPILRYEWFERVSKHHPEWVEVTPEGYILPWKEVGDRPACLVQRFPDL